MWNTQPHFPNDKPQPAGGCCRWRFSESVQCGQRSMYGFRQMGQWPAAEAVVPSEIALKRREMGRSADGAAARAAGGAASFLYAAGDSSSERSRLPMEVAENLLLMSSMLE